MLEEDRILKINIENEMKTAYIDYSMSVIVSTSRCPMCATASSPFIAECCSA